MPLLCVYVCVLFVNVLHPYLRPENCCDACTVQRCISAGAAYVCGRAGVCVCVRVIVSLPRVVFIFALRAEFVCPKVHSLMVRTRRTSERAKRGE